MTRSLLALTLTVVVAASAAAQAPRLIPYQGVLLEDGSPVTASTSVEFSLHDAATGGTEVWDETQTVDPDDQGRFDVLLGETEDLPPFGEPLWLEVAVGGTTLGPRTPLGAAPYALGLFGVRVEPSTSQPGPFFVPSIIGGHPANTAVDDLGRRSPGAVIGGGGNEDQPNTAGTFAVVGGGRGNAASTLHATISGGRDNTASGSRATVGGGSENTASSQRATVGGGAENTASGSGATVGGGDENTASGSGATVGGGDENEASGRRATVPGGSSNVASGDESFAAGQNSSAVHDGAFVWNSDFDVLESTAEDQFLIGAEGGVGIGTNAPAAMLDIEVPQFGDLEVALRAVSSEGTAGSFTSTSNTTALEVTQRSSGAIAEFFNDDDLRVRIARTGDVTADGQFTGGGADFAEFFALEAGATVAPGDVVGLHGGRVSLDTDGADQVMVVSSDPAFVGNPALEDGGALVALVGQVEVALEGDARPGYLLVASGRGDGTARAVSPSRYTATDGAVIGRVLEAEAGRALALVGVDEAAALRAVVARQARALQAQASEIDALEARLARLEAALTPAP